MAGGRKLLPPGLHKDFASCFSGDGTISVRPQIRKALQFGFFCERVIAKA